MIASMREKGKGMGENTASVIPCLLCGGDTVIRELLVRHYHAAVAIYPYVSKNDLPIKVRYRACLGCGNSTKLPMETAR